MSADQLDESAHTLPEIELARHAEAERLLGKLSERQRAVFVLYVVDELSAPEIASRLKLSQGAVRSRLRDTRAIFRREVPPHARGSALPVQDR